MVDEAVLFVTVIERHEPVAIVHEKPIAQSQAPSTSAPLTEASPLESSGGRNKCRSIPEPLAAGITGSDARALVPTLSAPAAASTVAAHEPHRRTRARLPVLPPPRTAPRCCVLRAVPWIPPDLLACFLAAMIECWRRQHQDRSAATWPSGACLVARTGVTLAACPSRKCWPGGSWSLGAGRPAEWWRSWPCPRACRARACFKVEGPADAPVVRELEGPRRSTSNRMQRDAERELRPVLEAIQALGGKAALARPSAAWVCARVREHLKLTEGLALD